MNSKDICFSVLREGFHRRWHGCYTGPTCELEEQVVFANMRLDIPRDSASPEFYSVSCCQASLVHPATTNYVEQLKPDMSRFAISAKRWQSVMSWTANVSAARSRRPFGVL